MKNIFMVAEKPSLAQSLAQILSNGKMSTKKGFNGACSIHEYSGVFKGDSARFKMTSVCGHVMGLDFTGKYNSWDKVDPAELFYAPTEKKETTPKLRMPNFLHSESRNCDYLVLWLDCDKEGENICFEVIDAVKESMKKFSMQNVYRAKFSAITDKDIKHAMNNLVAPNKNEASSVDARMELDLRIGCSFTRFQTKFFQGKYGNLDSTLISYGPCQTPTLGFCVERHDKIQSFKPEPYWVIQVQLTHPNGKTLYPEWDRIRMFDKEIAQMFLNIVRAEKEAKVISVTKKEKVKQRPLALNTVELMRVASSALGMAPHHAMQIAERLYTQGYISYPRTETTHYPENFDILGALRHQTSNSTWGSDVKSLLAEGIQRPRKGNDAGDHPPITPMKSASENELGGEAWRLYEFITKNFIATVSADCHYLQTTIKLDINSELFTCVGKTLISPGFTSVMTWLAISAEESLPEVNKGDICAVEEVKMVEKQTGPPDYLTESELITLMEKHGIGTDASIPVHINNICQRNYVTVESGRRLIPTPLGIVLVHGYQKIDPDLVLPTMRSAVEEQLNLIAIGKVNFWAVLQHTIEIFKLKFHYFVKSISNMDELFEVTFSPLSESGKPLSRCGKCRRFMKLIQAKPLRLHCSNCSATYSLPQNGSIKLHQELKCPLDDFELVLWSAGAKGKSYSLCPYCYSNPPFPDMRKGMGCNECTHPVCPHSLSSIGVCNCSECERGIIVLDALAKWKLACNKCNVVIDIFEDAHKVAVLEDVCEECNAQFMKVEYKLEKTKLPDNKTEYSGCIFCDKNLISLVQMHYGAAQHPMYRQRGGGNSSRGGRSSRGRGRGRGRSRGKGRGRPKDKMAQLAAYFV